MEWGIFGRYNLGNKSTTEFKADKDTDMVKSYNLTQDELEDLFGTTLGIAAPYDHIKSARKFFAGNQLRFTVTYFFNK